MLGCLHILPFLRAHAIRKDYPGLTEGMQKCQDAIMNSLSRTKGFNFDDLRSCIVKLVEERQREEEKEMKENLKRMGEETADTGPIGYSDSADTGQATY